MTETALVDGGKVTLGEGTANNKKLAKNIAANNALATLKARGLIE
jgi:dsRNA-specific ribonuclease